MAGPKILICEGEGIVALDLQKSLHDMGYQAPVVVSTAKEAVEAALSMNPDLIVTGIHLQRNHDGIEAVEVIRARVNVPVIYLTADSSTGTLERSSCTRPYAYLLKPFRLDQVHASIQLALHNHRLDAIAGDEPGPDRQKILRGISPRHKSGPTEVPADGCQTGGSSEQMIPICSCCKQIRDDCGIWIKPEDYFRGHFDFMFTHTLCPECVKVLRAQHR